MARFFLSRDAMDLASGVIPITGDDAHHIAFSLRMAVGDALTVCDMQKTEYACTITDIKPDLVLLRIDAVRENRTELPLEICLYQSLPKGDKMDTIVQKAVELGVTRVVPVAGARCIVKLDEKNAQKKVARWQKIADNAASQSRRGIIPKVREVLSLKEASNLCENFDKSFEYFDVAKKKSSGRCFRKCDKKYKEFYLNYNK